MSAGAIILIEKLWTVDHLDTWQIGRLLQMPEHAVDRVVSRILDARLPRPAGPSSPGPDAAQRAGGAG